MPLAHSRQACAGAWQGNPVIPPLPPIRKKVISKPQGKPQHQTKGKPQPQPQSQSQTNQSAQGSAGDVSGATGSAGAFHSLSDSDDQSSSKEKDEKKFDPIGLSVNKALMANPRYKDYYVGPDKVLDHVDMDLLEKLGKMAHHGLLFSEAFSDHGTSACQVIGPSTIEAFITSANQEGYTKQHGKKGRLIHTNSNIAKELGWTKIEHDKWLQQSTNFVRDVFNNPSLEVEVSGLLSSLGVSKTGGFCHIDHKHQIILHLDSNGPKSTVLHRQNPVCTSSYEYLLPMLSYLPECLLSHLNEKHADKIDAVAEAVGLTATVLEESLQHLCPRLEEPSKKKEPKQKRSKKKDGPYLSSEAMWADRARNQQGFPLQRLSPFAQKLAVIISRLQELSMMENVNWKSLPEIEGGLSWKLEEGNMYHDWGGLLCINPQQMESNNILNADKEFELTQVDQYSATKFCGSIHANPDRNRTLSRAVVLLAAREVEAQKNGVEHDEKSESYTGAEQITQLYLLSSLYEELVLDSKFTSFPGEEDDPDLWDWLHMIFLELMFQNVRCVDAPYSYYYLLRSLHQSVFYAGFLIRMAFDEKIMKTAITKLYVGGTVTRGTKGGKKLTKDEKANLQSLQSDLLQRAKEWKAKSQEEKEELKERVKNTQHPRKEPMKSVEFSGDEAVGKSNEDIDEESGDGSGGESDEDSDEEYDEALWLSFWKKEFERNTFYFKMHSEFIDEDDNPKALRRSKRKTPSS